MSPREEDSPHTAISMPPKRFALLQGLILVHVARVIGLSFLVGMSQGLFEPAFAIPTAFGDFLIALTAPLVVLALRRGGLMSWAAAVAWSALGLADFAVAITVGSLLRLPPSSRFLGPSYPR